MHKHEQIYHLLCEEITARLDRKEHTLPTESALCDTYKVSRQTIRAALERLKSEKIVTSRQGSGTVLTGLYPQQTNQIVIMVQDPESYIAPALISEISGFFDRRHFSVSVIRTGTDRNVERQALTRLLEDPPRGLMAECICSALPTPNADLYRQLDRKNTKIVFLGSRYPNLFLGAVAAADDQQGGLLLAEEMIRLGHQQIGALLFAHDLSGQEKYLGMAKALRNHGLPLPDRRVIWIDPRDLDSLRNDRSGRQMHRILEALPSDTSCLACQNDELAFWALRCLEQSGKKIPADIHVAGFDGSYLSDTGMYSLTTMETDSFSQFACQIMLSSLLGSDPIAKRLSWRLRYSRGVTPSVFLKTERK